VESDPFYIEADCTNNIDISLPVGFAADQTFDATVDTAADITYKFSSFQTTTSAC